MSLRLLPKEQQKIKKAKKTCLEILEKNFSQGAFLAGPKIHRDWWSPDNLFTALTIFPLGFKTQTKSAFDFFLDWQDKEGLIPLRVERSSHSLRFLGINKTHKKLKPVYTSSQPFSSGKPVANNALLVVVGEIIAQKENLKWLDLRFEKIKKAFFFLKKNTRRGLLYSGRIADWDDNITLKSGFTLYANCLYFGALSAMVSFYSLLKKLKLVKKLKNQAQETKDLIQKKFWNGNYFDDWITPAGKYFSHFDTFGNILAILFDVANPKQARQIQKFIIKNKIDQPPIRQKFPALPFPHNLINKLIGFPYKTHYCWPWIGGFDVVAKLKTGFTKEAKERFLDLTKIINQLGPIEVIRLDGQPVKGLFYESEKNFTLAAATFLFALNHLKQPSL